MVVGQMVSQRLQTSKPGNKKAKKAFLRNHLTEIQLAVQVGLNNPDVVEKFFRGEPINRNIFQQLCWRLGLNWEEIYELDPNEIQNYTSEVNALVDRVRKMVRPKIEERRGNIRLLARSEAVSLDDIYPLVHILESNPRHQLLNIAEWPQKLTSEKFDRLGLGQISESRVLGLKAIERYPKVMVLGKPGSGKTTFLQYLALQCNSGKFNRHLVPIFITLKNFAQVKGKPSLLEYITHVYAPNNENQTLFVSAFQELIARGRVMILLDGLDEVGNQYQNRILQQIREFTEKFDQNQFAIACRMAGPEYALDKFVEIQVADLEFDQIVTLASKWFQNSDQSKIDTFLHHLQQNPSIQTLATNPLLLVLLFLVFEEHDYFSTNHLELYQQGLEILLERWDDRKTVEGDWVYRNLSLGEKQDLLDRIALSNFNRAEYFVKKTDLVQYILEYISQFTETDGNLSTLPQKSEIILKSVETQHGLLVERTPGLFSFYHPAFQHYFTARAIVKAGNTQSLLSLVNSVTQSPWREVFLLASEMSSNSDELLQLMKSKIDRLIGSDQKLQQFLTWADEKSLSVPASFQRSAVRSFYLALSPKLNSNRSDLQIDLTLTRACDPAFDLAVERFLHLDYLLNLAFARALAPTLTRDLALTLAYVQARVRVLAFDFPIDPEFEASLANLKKQLTQSDDAIKTKMKDWQTNPQVWTERLKMARKWWQANRLAWTEQLKTVMLQYRNLGHDWQFSYHQEQLLKEYYYGNQLLIDCLNRAHSVSDRVRTEIETTLLLPIAKIEQRKTESASPSN